MGWRANEIQTRMTNGDHFFKKCMVKGKRWYGAEGNAGFREGLSRGKACLKIEG